MKTGKCLRSAKQLEKPTEISAHRLKGRPVSVGVCFSLATFIYVNAGMEERRVGFNQYWDIAR